MARLLAMTAVAILLFAALAQAQKEITPEFARELGIEAIHVTFDCELQDATRAFTKGHGSQQQHSAESFKITGGKIKIHVLDGDGQRVIVDASPDISGRLVADLGLRFKGTEVRVFAEMEDGAALTAFPLTVGKKFPDQLRLYRFTSDPAILQQELMRIVTRIDPNRIQVRQVAMVSNFKFFALGGYVYPVPPGATVTSLQVDGETQTEVGIKEHAHWGSGVVIMKIFLPSIRGATRIMGTYELSVPRQQTIDLGIRSATHTDFTLAIEADLFHYIEPKNEAVSGLVSGGRQEIPGTGRVMENFQLRGIKPGTVVVAEVLYGKLPIHPRTLLITALLIVGVIGPIVLGILLRRARDKGSTQMHRADIDVLAEIEGLDASMVAGKISVEEYRRQVRQLSEGSPREPATRG